MQGTCTDNLLARLKLAPLVSVLETRSFASDDSLCSAITQIDSAHPDILVSVLDEYKEYRPSRHTRCRVTAFHLRFAQIEGHCMVQALN